MVIGEAAGLARTNAVSTEILTRPKKVWVNTPPSAAARYWSSMRKRVLATAR